MPQTTAESGNSFLDALNGVLDFGSRALGQYSGFLDAKALRQVNNSQSTTIPSSAVTVPTSNGNNFMSNPENLQKTLLYVGVASVIAIGGYILIKKL